LVTREGLGRLAAANRVECDQEPGAIESTNAAFIGSTKSGKGIAARVGFAEVAETPID